MFSFYNKNIWKIFKFCEKQVVYVSKDLVPLFSIFSMRFIPGRRRFFVTDVNLT